MSFDSARREEWEEEEDGVWGEIKSNFSKDGLPLSGCWDRAGGLRRVCLSVEEKEVEGNRL